MVNEKNVRQYETTIAINALDGTNLYKFACDELLARHYSISERIIDACVEFCIAKWKRIIELCVDFTERKKEAPKQSYELSIRSLGIWCKNYLLKQRRFASYTVI